MTLRALRYVSIAEATSFVLLLVATALKYAGPRNEVGVQVLGPIHGGLFVLYVGLAVIVAVQLRWRPLRSLLVLAASLVPLAPYVVQRVWLRPQDDPSAVR